MFASYDAMWRYLREEAFTAHDGLMTFDDVNWDDVSAAQRGNLTEQNDDFVVILFNLESPTRRIGPGETAAKRVHGSLSLRRLSKDARDELGQRAQLETLANHFAERTLVGIRFREFTPTPTIRRKGFFSFGGVVPFECEIRANTRA